MKKVFLILLIINVAYIVHNIAKIVDGLYLYGAICLSINLIGAYFSIKGYLEN